MRDSVVDGRGPVGYLVINVGIYLGASAAGALVASVLSYVFTSYGSVPGHPLGAIIGGAVFLLAPLVSIGLPLAIGLAIVSGWLTARRDIARSVLVGMALVAGMAWLVLVFWPSFVSAPPSPVALSLLLPWLLFGLVLRRRTPTPTARDIPQR